MYDAQGPRAPARPNSASRFVAPDGSPVAVYLAMPPHDALDLVADQVPLAGSVLDLGCGVGRLANALAGRGFYVTGVDNHAEMLAHLDPRVRGVLGDIATVDVGRLFDVVVLASHLVNEPDLGAAFLATCRRHVVADGVVLIERFHPALLDDLDQQEGVVDGVHVRHEIHERAGTVFAASAHYTVDATTWTQRYRAVLLDDAALRALLASVGLRHDCWLDHDERWILARPI